MTVLAPSAQGRVFALELDVLRGLAALLMIVNHAGFRLLSAADATTSASGVAVFLGGFAPVVFFFATGFGIALATGPRARELDIVALLWKAALLVVADQFFFWRAGVAWGIDFFGFIALSTVVVTLIARLPRPTSVCAGLILALLGLRFGLGPVLRQQLQGSGVLEWVIGVTTIANVAYPLSPWMVYPLLGFVLGRRYSSGSLQSSQHRDRWLKGGLAWMIVTFGAASLLALLGVGFFRWGTVSSAFFVLSLGILAAFGLLAMYLAKSHVRLADALALRGVASFAVIPIHYALLDVCAATLTLPFSQAAFAMLATVIAAASLIAASCFSAVVSGPFFAMHRRALLVGLSLVLVAVASATVLASADEPMRGAMLVLTGQLLVAALLGIRVRRAR